MDKYTSVRNIYHKERPSVDILLSLTSTIYIKDCSVLCISVCLDICILCISGPWDHDPSQMGILNQRNHPGDHAVTAFTFGWRWPPRVHWFKVYHIWLTIMFIETALTPSIDTMYFHKELLPFHWSDGLECVPSCLVLPGSHVQHESCLNHDRSPESNGNEQSCQGSKFHCRIPRTGSQFLMCNMNHAWIMIGAQSPMEMNSHVKAANSTAESPGQGHSFLVLGS